MTTQKQAHIDNLLTEIQQAVDFDLTAAGYDMFANEGEYSEAYGKLRTLKSDMQASFELMPDSLTSDMVAAIETRTVSLLTESQLFSSDTDSRDGEQS